MTCYQSSMHRAAGWLLVLLLMVPVCAFAMATTTRVNVTSSGTQGYGIAWSPRMSPDGRYIVYDSWAANLVPNDTNGCYDAFLRDQVAGITERVSLTNSGQQVNDNSGTPSVSADGRYIVFESFATNIVPNVVPKTMNIFIRDRQLKTTTLVSMSTTGTPGNATSANTVISDDGRFVTFQSDASNLVPGDTNGGTDIFEYEVATKKLTRVSVSGSGVQGNRNSRYPSISGDGRYVAFISEATNLVSGDTNGLRDVFVHDRITGSTERVNLSSTGAQANLNSGDTRHTVSISADGRYVAFESLATNLAPGESNNTYDIFVRDRQAGTTERASVSSTGIGGDSASQFPAISADGRYVVFQSAASNLVPADANNVEDIFMHDRLTGQTIRASVTMAGTSTTVQSGGIYGGPEVSIDGRMILFQSYAENLVPNDTNSTRDIFLRTLDSWPNYQPDVQVRSGSQTAYLGDNTYNTLVGQTVARTVSTNTVATYVVKVQNDGTATDTMVVKGNMGGAGWTVRYFDQVIGGNEITSSVTGSGWSVALAAGGMIEIRLEVTADTTIPNGTVNTVLVTVTSRTAPTRFDAVQAATTINPQHQPDLQISADGGSSYIGKDSYNTADTQSVVRAVGTGATAAYQLRIENDGNASDTFMLTGAGGGDGWQVRYFDSATGGLDITDQMIGLGTYAVGPLAPGVARTLRLEVTPDGTVAAGATWPVTVSATCAAAMTATDTVQAITGQAALSSVRLVTSPRTPVAVGTSVTLTAVPTGGTAVRYWFRVQSGTVWTDLHPYSAAATCTWTPKTAGSYTLQVLAKEATSAKLYEVYTVIAFVVKPAIIAVNLTADPATGAMAGQAVRLTGVATGGVSLQYWFRVQSGGIWRDIQPYATSASCTWVPAVAGNYTLEVMVREAGSTKVYEAYKVIPYAVRPAS